MTWISYGNTAHCAGGATVAGRTKTLADEMTLDGVIYVAIAFVQVQAALCALGGSAGSPASG